MGDTKPLTPADREDLVAYLDNEADPVATERVQDLLEKNPAAREEKELFEESWRLLDVLNQLVAQGNTVVVIEHNLDVVKTADHIVDLGPEGGDEGGRVLAAGTPEQLADQSDVSYTGRFLAHALGA
jgi:Excinuclease ATPase subunit